MSKKAFKSQASSSRATLGVFGSQGEGFGSAASNASSTFPGVPSSSLSYVYEPPDLSRVADPNVVILLKNAQKKDATTKAKALEELYSYVQNLATKNSSLEIGIVEAWIMVYPRTSIDSSRRVRQLAHMLQGQISLLCGKGIAKYLAKVIGAWLAGLNDNDKLVAYAATEAFKKTFRSDERQENAWKVFRVPILDYCRGVLFHETVASLSDERVTSPDDAEAKYARVLGSALLVVARTIDNSSLDDTQPQSQTYRDILGQESLWKLAIYHDPFVRKSLYHLAAAALRDDIVELLDLKVVSKYAVIAALRFDQRGAAYEYSKMLAHLSMRRPEVWRLHSESTKKSPYKCLCQFLTKGSQGAPADFWKRILTVIRHIPLDVLSLVAPNLNSNFEGRINAEILEAIHEGILRKEESRLSQSEAWITYLETVLILMQSDPSPAAKLQLLENMVVPIIEQHLRSDEKQRRWNVSGSSTTEVVMKALDITLATSPEGFRGAWNRLSELFIQDIQTSLPEQCEAYAKSQDDNGAKASRWYQFQAIALKANDPAILSTTFTLTIKKEMQIAIDILVARKGKPYCAANSIAIAVQCIPRITLQDNEIMELVTVFLQEQLAGLALSPSLPYLITVADQIRAAGGEVQGACIHAVGTIVDSDASALRSRALKTLLGSSWIGEGSSSIVLGDLLQNELEQSLKGHLESWDFVVVAMANPVIPAALARGLISTMTASLSVDEQLAAGLQGLDIATKKNMPAVRDFSRSSNGSSLLSRLLLLSDSPSQTISNCAKALYKSIENALTGAGGPENQFTPMIRVIRESLFECGSDSVSVETLVEQTAKLIQQCPAKDQSILVQRMLPNSDQWYATLEPFMIDKPNTALAITNKLGGALYLIDSSQEDQGRDHTVNYDLEGYSLPIRIVLYVANILKVEHALVHVNDNHKRAILEIFSVFAELATDRLSVSSSPDLWKADVDVESEMSDLLIDTQSFLSANLQFHAELAQQHWHRSRGMSVASYYSARAYTSLMNQPTDGRPSIFDANKQQHLRSKLEERKLAFNAIASLISLADLKLALNLCNGYIDAIAGVDFNFKPFEALYLLTLFNCLISSQEDLVGSIPQRRLVFHVKHLSTVLQNAVSDPLGNPNLEAEVYKNLVPILMQIPNLYGDFWGTTMTSIVRYWSRLSSIADEDVPVVFASLKLYAALERISSMESNDDFSDSWMEKKPFLTLSMIRLMKISSDHPDESHQPRRIVNDLLTRLVTKKAPSELADVSLGELYSIMAYNSRSLQEAAYKILQDKIPFQQEQISIEAALSDSFTAQLPSELLSLILVPPDIDLEDAAGFGRGIPLPLQTYLLTWILIFDHWKRASYNVQNQYAGCIKNGPYLNRLLNYIFDNVITRPLRPVDASRFTIARFSLHEEDSLERAFQWLLCHLYYLCLLNLPLLSRAWWRDETSRQLQRPVEEWTAKYITPVVITTTLESLERLTGTIEEPLEVKAQHRAKEVVATYPIDDQSLSIKLPLPPTYPLAPITVLTSNRVGIEEKKWHSWLLTISGIINFPASSSASPANPDDGGSGGAGAILDGILVWRRNVEGALKGQSECSICYSIVGADRQLPNKRCGTCRNFFHGGCLFRWFRSSNSSSCPLCRNAFNYS